MTTLAVGQTVVVFLGTGNGFLPVTLVALDIATGTATVELKGFGCGEVHWTCLRPV